MKIIVALIIAIAVGVGAWVVFGNDSSDTTTSKNSTEHNHDEHEHEGSQPTIAEDDAQVAATIMYTNTGFDPSTITIKSGQTVEIKNDSSRPLQFDSDPHPAHTDNPELNVDTISPGSSKKFTLTTKGAWSYHNHLNSSETGKVNVE